MHLIDKYLVYIQKYCKYYKFIINTYAEKIYLNILSDRYLLHKLKEMKTIKSFLFLFSSLPPFLYLSSPPLSLSLYVCVYTCVEIKLITTRKEYHVALYYSALFFVRFSFLHFLLLFDLWSEIAQSIFRLLPSIKRFIRLFVTLIHLNVYKKLFYNNTFYIQYWIFIEKTSPESIISFIWA